VQDIHLVNGSDFQRLFLKTMKRHREEALQQARDRHMKFRESAKFFFLKGGLDQPPDQRAAFESTETKVLQAKGSKTRERGVRSETEISALQDKTSDGAERLDLSAKVTQSVSDLIRLARTGNRLMVGKLHGIAVQTIAALYDIAGKRPEVLRSIARMEFSWPALIGRKRFIKQLNERLVTSLQLGEGDAFSTRGWQLLAPSTQAALDLFLTAKLYQKDWNLAALTEKNKRTWFEVAWQQMLNEGIVPEKIPWLAPLGKSAIGKRSISRGMPAQTDGMKRDDTRAEIKRQIRNAFDNLVAGASEKSK
jgi:hypothetical protein